VFSKPALSVFFAAICSCSDAHIAETNVPPIEIGMLVGRDGVAFGPGILLQGNWQELGLYDFGGEIMRERLSSRWRDQRKSF
jgi:hypothetical protein